MEKLALEQHADGSITAKALDHPNRQNFIKVEGSLVKKPKKHYLMPTC